MPLLIAIDKLLVACHEGAARALLHVPTTPHALTEHTHCGTTFAVEAYHIKGKPLSVTIRRSISRTSGDWLGLVAAGAPNEVITDTVVDLDQLPPTAFASDGTISFVWPTERAPQCAGMCLSPERIVCRRIRLITGLP